MVEVTRSVLNSAPMAPPRRARRFTPGKNRIFRTGIVLLLLMAICNVWLNAGGGGSRGVSVEDIMPRSVPSIADHVPPIQLINDNPNRKHTSKPLEMLHEYQKFHSQQVLLEEHENGGIHNRTFVVGFYACPDAAGNRMHEFFNSMIIAMAHNYTITWKFFDEWTCRNVGTNQPIKWCKFAVNSLETCAAVVERASWIASYDDWSGKLNMTFGARSKLKESYHYIPNDNKAWVPKERNVPVPLVQQGQIKDPIALERLKELYSLGTYYLYGMLFHEIFPFHDSVQPSADLAGGDKDEISIVVHSRHVKVRQYTGSRLLELGSLPISPLSSFLLLRITSTAPTYQKKPSVYKIL